VALHRIGLTVLITGLYVGWFAGAVGWRTEHGGLLGLLLAGYWLGPRTRRWLWGLLPFLLFWVVYDSLRVWPNYSFRPVHIQDLYQLDKALFGIGSGPERQTAVEWLQGVRSTAWDALAGLFYLTWVPIPLLVGVYWLNTRQSLYLRFAWAFLTVNLLGFVLYYVVPAAPPWYIAEYGYGFNPAATGNPAGLSRFDYWLGLPVFSGIYSKNANVFGAFPSLHAAYPVIVSHYVTTLRKGLPTVLCWLWAAGIWLAAVYSAHHYVIDVLGGIGCAITGIALLEGLRRTVWGRQFRRHLLNRIT